MTALRGTKKCAPLFFGNLNFFDGSPYFDFECRVVRFKISDDLRKYYYKFRRIRIQYTRY